MTSLPTDPRTLVNTLRVILFALTFGLVSFTGVAVYLNLTVATFGGASAEEAEVYTWILAGLGIASALVAALAGRRRSAPPVADGDGGDGSDDEERRVGDYARRTILRAALAEGFGLFGAVSYLLTAQLHLLAAPAIAVAALLSLLPGEGTIRELFRDAGRDGGVGGPPIEP